MSGFYTFVIPVSRNTPGLLMQCEQPLFREFEVLNILGKVT